MVEIVAKEDQDLNLDGDYVADLGVPFICPNCNELFGSQEYLSQHTDVCHGLKNGFTLHPDFDSHQISDYSDTNFNESTPSNSSSLYSTQKPYSHHNSLSSSVPSNHETTLPRNELSSQPYSMFLLDSHEQSSSFPSLPSDDHVSVMSHLPLQRNDVLLSSTTEKLLSTAHLSSSFELNPVGAQIPSASCAEPARCPSCQNVFTNQWLLTQHIQQCPKLSSIHKVDISSLDTPSSCDFDDFGNSLCSSLVTTQEKTPRGHLGEVLPTKGSSVIPHVCPDCGKCFAVSSSLREHVRTHTGEKPFNCEECGQKFVNKSNLRKHYRTHTQEKPFHCPVCSVSFSLRSGLTIHLRTHTGEKPYECSECGQKFSSSGNLKKHEIMHTGDKPFSCKVCGRRYQSDESLKAHLLTHTGEKSYQCPICDVAFSHRGGLEAHFRTHSGEKPFSCDYCDLTFARRGGLKAHVRTHTGEKPYSCSLCPLAFAHKSNLNAHFRTHTGEKPFSCSFCDQKFAHKSNLKKHLNTHQDRPIVSPLTENIVESVGLNFDTSLSTSSSVISTVMVSPFAVSQDSNIFDLLDMLEHSSTQALVKT